MKTFALHIADFNVKVNTDESLHGFPANYKPFVSNDAEGEDWLLTYNVGHYPINESKTELMGTFDDLGYKQEIYSRPEGGYLFKIYETSGILAATMLSNANFSDNTVCIEADEITAKVFGINNTLMIAFAFASAYHSTLLMHSSVTKKGDWAYMFLGKSGTGKSTHSSLWLKHIAGTSLLNDDNPVLRIKDGIAIVYGSPWSGKTPCYKQEKAKVGALVMLEQKPYNKISKENIVTALSSLLCSCSIMIWDKPSYGELMKTMSSVISLVGVHHLECLPDEAAAQLSYSTINKD